jgi:hypothetical protein
MKVLSASVATADDVDCVSFFSTKKLNVVATFTPYVNGVAKTPITSTANMPDDEDLTVSFGIQNGEAVAKTMTVDYILAAMDR